MDDNPVKRRQRRALEKSKERIQTARLERDRIKNPTFKRIIDPLPEYKSPYNKEIVQGEISINKLIDKKTHSRLKKLGRPRTKKKRKGQGYINDEKKLKRALNMSTTKYREGDSRTEFQTEYGA
jgi:hypothetical protein